MEALIRIANNTINLDSKKILFKIYSETEVQDFIIDLNRIEQLFKKGVDIEGNIFGTYSPLTETLSQGRSFGFGGDSGSKTKRAGDPIFLLDDGDFYRSFKIRLKNNGSFTISAVTDKDDFDLLDYGDIIGLSNNSINELIKEILPFIIQETREAILQ